jgi:predicted PurR-regulated permease PerM
MRIRRKTLGLPDTLIPDETGRLRAGVPRALVILIGAASMVVILAGVRQVAWLIGPVFLALVIVITANPVQMWLRRHGWPRWLAAAALMVVVYVVLLGLFAVVVVSIAELATVLPQYVSQANSAVQKAVNTLGGAGVGRDQLRDVASSLDVSKLVSLAKGLVGAIGGVVTNVFFLLALLLFLSVEATWAEERFASIARDRPWITGALQRFAGGTRSYMLVTTVFGFIVAVLDTVALYIIGVPGAILWGLLAFVTNYIPNIGFIIGVVPPALLALLVGGWVKAVIVVVVYCALNFVVQSLIQPQFVAGSVGLSTIVTVLALVFWAWLLGPLGAILAVPATLLCKALFVDIDPKAGWADALLSQPPKPGRKPPLESAVPPGPVGEPAGTGDRVGGQ